MSGPRRQRKWTPRSTVLPKRSAESDRVASAVSGVPWVRAQPIGDNTLIALHHNLPDDVWTALAPDLQLSPERAEEIELAAALELRRAASRQEADKARRALEKRLFAALSRRKRKPAKHRG